MTPEQLQAEEEVFLVFIALTVLDIAVSRDTYLLNFEGFYCNFLIGQYRIFY